MTVGVPVVVAVDDGVGVFGQPPKATLTAASSSSMVTSPLPSRSKLGQLAIGCAVSAMFTPRTSSLMLISPSPSQSPTHARAAPASASDSATPQHSAARSGAAEVRPGAGRAVRLPRSLTQGHRSILSNRRRRKRQGESADVRTC